MVIIVSTPQSVALPLGVEPITVPCERAELAALRVGGDPQVVLVPGFTGSKEDFLPLLPLFDQAGISAVAIDLLGQYESPGPPDVSQYSAKSWAADLLDLADALGHPVHLVGHSMGGLICREATLAAPQTVHSLTLMCSGPAALPESAHPIIQTLLAALPSLSLAQIYEAKLELDDPPNPKLPLGISAFLERRWLLNTPAALAGMSQLLLTAPDRTAELRRVAANREVAVLVMFGADDQEAWPTALQAEMARQLGVPAIAIRDAAHSPAIENTTDTFAALANFWEAR